MTESGKRLLIVTEASRSILAVVVVEDELVVPNFDKIVRLNDGVESGRFGVYPLRKMYCVTRRVLQRRYRGFAYEG